MPIQSGDIKLLESDTMDDTPQGGGATTGNAIVDGASNNIFEDVSTLDRTYGAVHMRKLFASIQTQTQDKYFGAHVIITKLPKDEKIGVNLFNTGDWFDRRPDAKGRVESYLAKGATYAGFLWATQWKDSKVVTIFQGATSPKPGVGDVLYLTNAAGTELQYVRISRFDSATQTFTDETGDYTRTILTLTISQPLLYDFVGSEISRFDDLDPDATIKTTVVANAAKYYSARPLALLAANTDLSIKVDTVYSQVIPNSQSETALVDQTPNDTNAGMEISSQGATSFTTGSLFTAGFSLYLGRGCYPGTLSIPVSGGTIVDAAGQIKIDGSGTSIGTINYSSGLIVFGSSSPNYSGTKTVSFAMATPPLLFSDSASIAVTPANRGYVWTENITPSPMPGSVRVSFMALGNWYELVDNSAGALVALEAGIGSGTINYATGSVTMTFAALPDAQSEIIVTWSQSSSHFNRSNFAVSPVTYHHTLQDTGIARGTFVMTWNDGAARTATADNSGNITGDATGKLKHALGEVEFTPNVLPLGGQTFTMDYQSGDPIEQVFGYPSRDVNGDLAIDLLTADLLPNTVEVEWNTFVELIDWKDDFEVTTTSITQRSRRFVQGTRRDPIEFRYDDGAGNMVDATGTLVEKLAGGNATINYATGVLVWKPDLLVSLPDPQYDDVAIGSSTMSTTATDAQWTTTTATTTTTFRQMLTEIIYKKTMSAYPSDTTGYVKIRYRQADSPGAISETFSPAGIDIDLTEQFAEDITRGSIAFTLGGLKYYDEQGQLYHSIDPATGAGIFAGTIDYTTGRCSISSWAPAGSSNVTLQSLLTSIGIEPIDSVTFRAAIAPVKVGQMEVRANAIDGTAISATADSTGLINTPEMQGFCVYETGVVYVRFGGMVVAAGNEAEDWYDPSAVTGDGYIFKQNHVRADSVQYNAVGQTFLPLDSDILGLDPVRLPQDGRIPIYADGDVVVVLHDQTTTGTYTNSTQTDLGRGRITKLSVRDSAGAEILATRYTADLDAGLIDWVDLSGVSQPLAIVDRIEDMAVLTDVQITGTLTLSQPLTHDFPADDTLVSNAVIYGDLFAHTTIPFDQQTWTGEWSDVLIGSDVAAQFNNSQYPIEVDNASNIEERWQVIFTNTTTVNVIGENVGQILTGVPISGDITPINPNTGQAYFTIPTAGWGGGWSAGNLLRFNTVAANVPLWVIQSVGQGLATDPDLGFCIEVRGDIDTP